LRRTLTPSEAKLWRHLRDRRAEFKFRRQHPIGPYVLDFYCPEAKLAVEVDGRQHAEPDQVRRDQERTIELGLQGVRVMRIPAAEVERSIEVVLQAIWESAAERRRRG
jgi:very-short-patch-repair endonuclease